MWRRKLEFSKIDPLHVLIPDCLCLIADREIVVFV